jgi:hypothetical protein
MPCSQRRKRRAGVTAPRTPRCARTKAAAKSSVITACSGATVMLPLYVKMKSIHTIHTPTRCSHRHPRPSARCDALFDVAAMRPSITKPAVPKSFVSGWIPGPSPTYQLTNAMIATRCHQCDAATDSPR